VFATVLCCAELAAQQPRLTVSPAKPSGGAIVRVTLDPGATQRDQIVAITGTMAGEPLHFRRGDHAQWRALGGIPVDPTESLTARVVAERSSGALDTVSVAVTIPRPPVRRGRARPHALSVAPRFSRPLDSATQARIDNENARAREIGRQSHNVPQLWSASFLKPRPSRITSRFGSGRMFNGTLTSRHLGVDFAGKIGAPVRAANRGVVALVTNFFLAGNVVYIDHGAGVVTGYFHLSKTLVAAGDTVARGQIIGEVGATGRVTGPHLHWSARYGALTVNPMDLVLLRGL
jgi:murein DD-endopeptidase MepM/ murein hydrolase activator NlpD